MKAIFEFNLPEENEEHQLFVNAPKWKGVVDELAAQLRSDLKYNNELTQEAREYAEMIHSKLYTILEEDGLSL